MEGFNHEVERVKHYLLSIDPILLPVFSTVNLQLLDVIKKPYPALIGAIIGQKIAYTTAKKLRGELYNRYGTEFTPETLINTDISFLGAAAPIIKRVTEYIISHHVNLDTCEGIHSLIAVSGIGTWTIDTTILTCLKDWDIFPLGDKFLQTRMKRLYGPNCNIQQISQKWSPYRSLVTWYLWRWF